jgi:hypothetical protein
VVLSFQYSQSAREGVSVVKGDPRLSEGLNVGPMVSEARPQWRTVMNFVTDIIKWGHAKFEMNLGLRTATTKRGGACNGAQQG